METFLHYLPLLIIVSFILLALCLLFSNNRSGSTDNVVQKKVVPLDTSRMLEITDSKPAETDLGKFGNRYCHMIAFDRDGRIYMFFMIEHNVRALANAGFVQEDFWLPLCGPGEQKRGFAVTMASGKKIEVYPDYLRDKDPLSQEWKLWDDLHFEFENRPECEENHLKTFRKYYYRGCPRQMAAN